MTIPLSQITLWAKLLPPVGLSTAATRAWRNFVPIELEGQRIAFPAKAALTWMKSVCAESVTFDAGTLFVRGQSGNSRIALRAYTKSIPCEEPYDARNAICGVGPAISERCEWTDMTVDGKTSGTKDERKEAARIKRIEKGKADYAKAKKELDRREKQADEARETLAQPLPEAIKDARTYLAALRLRRAYEANPTVFPSWMPETCTRNEFDMEKQECVDTEHKTRELWAELVGKYEASMAEKDAYKPITRWPSYYTAADKKRNPDMGQPVYGPKWDKLNESVASKRESLLRFLGSQFREYLTTQNMPSELAYGWSPRPYSRARILLKEWENEKGEVLSQVAEARARLDKAESGWQYWQKDEKANWIHESDVEKLDKARAMGASCEEVACQERTIP